MTRPEVPTPRTAIVPAAGLGTRFLPATKTVPKELLPVVDTPGIELVAAEAADARGKHVMLEKVRRAPALIKVESVVQSEPLGLGHAVGCVEQSLMDDEDAVA